MAGPFKSFSDFYPYYLSEHQDARCRRLHFLGSLVGLACLVGLAVTGIWWLLLVGLVAGYACAWIGHFVFEKNRPATFRYPLWSFVSDFRMLGCWLSGRLAGELARHGIDDRGRAP